MKKLALILTVILGSRAQAQEPNKSGLHLKISGVEFAHSRYFGGQHTMGLQDLINFAPNAEFTGISGSNYLDYYYSSYYRDNSHRGILANVYFDIRKGEKPAFWGNPTFRLGISYQQGDYGLGRFTNSSTTFYDSLSSTYQGVTTMHAVDSVHSEDHSFNLASNRLRLNTSFLLRTNQSKRFSFYAGLGIGFGVSINSELRYQRSSSDFYHVSGYSGPYDLQGLLPSAVFDMNFRYYRTNPIYDFTVSVPIGVAFRIGNSNEFWKHAYLFAEVAPVLSYTKYGGSKSYTNIGYSGTLGLRFKL